MLQPKSWLAWLIVIMPVATAHGALIASYSANGNANDSVAGRNGTLQNGAGFDTGISGQAFCLDGSNDFVSVPDDNVWTFGSNDFSIALWGNLDSIREDSFRQLPNVFIGHSPGAGNQNKWVFFYDEDGSLMFLNGPNNIDGVNFLRSPTTFFPTIGEWHHFAVTRSGGNTYTFYADGLSLGTATSAVVTPNATGPLTIGQAEGLGFIDGRLDEIQIYDEALSASQIAQLAIPEPASAVLWVLGAALGLFAKASSPFVSRGRLS